LICNPLNIGIRVSGGLEIFVILQKQFDLSLICFFCFVIAVDTVESKDR
jgi:hypothetical protein